MPTPLVGILLFNRLVTERLGGTDAYNQNMKLLPRILPIQNIVLDLSATSKKRAFEYASLLFENNNGIERAAIYETLFARERLGSTGLGQGIAVPHGRVKGIKQAAAAFLRLARPIAFDSPDREPVSLLLFVIAPESQTQEHLDILAEVATQLSNQSLRERLAVETDPHVVHALLTTPQVSA